MAFDLVRSTAASMVLLRMGMLTETSLDPLFSAWTANGRPPSARETELFWPTQYRITEKYLQRVASWPG